jgi:hypothetical protein
MPRRRSRASQEEFRRFLDALASKAPNVPELRAEKFSRATDGEYCDSDPG